MTGTHSHSPDLRSATINRGTELARCIGCSQLLVRRQAAGDDRWRTIAEHIRAEYGPLMKMTADERKHYEIEVSLHHSLSVEQESEYGSLNCGYCGMSWKSMPLDDGPLGFWGCAERLDAQYTLWLAGEASPCLLVPAQRSNAA